MIENKNNKINRRLASRVYEQANLFYQKVDPKQIGNTTSEFDTMLSGDATLRQVQSVSSVGGSELLDQSLPDSQSLENDTLNVNISSSGIAFSCRDQLKPGDRLKIRIFLLSRNMVIMTCCKIVYCKLSNPYEINLYPYCVGAQFVNLTPEDKALLDLHIRRRRKQRWAINSIWIILALLVLTMPEEIVELTLESVELFVETFWEAVDKCRDVIGLWVSYALDHSLRTNPRTTQIIGFYVQTAFEFAVVVVSLRMLWLGVKRLWINSLTFLSRKKASFLYYWREKTWLGKLKIISIVVGAVSAYVLLLL